MNAMDVALICKALGDANRLEIVKMLSDGEKCGCKLLERFEITQPTLSHHMKILVECGLVNARKEGKWQHQPSLLEPQPQQVSPSINSFNWVRVSQFRE